MTARRSRVRFALLATAALSAAFAWVGASAQSYPNRPIEIIAHSSPGGGTDLFARAIADMMAKQKIFDQPFVISNRTGGSGTIALNYTKSKRGDPHYMQAIATGTLLTAASRPDLGLGLDQFTPVAFFAQDPQAIAVRTESKFKTLKDLVEAAKRSPDSVTAGMGSATGTARIAMYDLERLSGGKFKYVHFKGGGEAVLSVLGGHTDFTAENMAEMMPLVESKKMRVLAVTGERRFAKAPDIPTLKELGFDMVAATGRGFIMPPAVPKEALATMEAALKRVHDSPEYRAYSERNMFEDKWMGSAEFGRWLTTSREGVKGFLDHMKLLKN